MEGLQGGSDSLRSEAIKKSQNVSEFEAAEILKTIFNIIQSSSSIDTSIFKSFIEWSKTRSTLYSDSLSKLTTIPSKSIKISFIPTIFDFGRMIEKLEEVKELSSKWSQENPRLKKAIEQELK